MIKVCIDPMCEEVAHNVEKKETRCRNCGMLLVEITEKTFRDKFFNNTFHIDYKTGNRVTMKELGINYQLSLF